MIQERDKAEAPMTDRYTKTILTIIAVCLVVIVIRDIEFTRPATAQAGPMHVILDSVQNFAFQFVETPLPVRAGQ